MGTHAWPQVNLSRNNCGQLSSTVLCRGLYHIITHNMAWQHKC